MQNYIEERTCHHKSVRESNEFIAVFLASTRHLVKKIKSEIKTVKKRKDLNSRLRPVTLLYSFYLCKFYIYKILEVQWNLQLPDPNF